MRLFWTKTIQNTFKHRFTGRLDTLSRTLWVISGDERSCLGRFYESTDMQRDLFRSGHVLDLKPNFQNALRRSNYISVDASQQEKHDSDDAGKMNVVLLFSQMLLQKNVFRKNGYFYFFCSLEAKPLVLAQIWGHVNERALKETAYLRKISIC